MRGAQQLLEVLSYARVGRWFEDALVQHLHRDTPDAQMSLIRTTSTTPITLQTLQRTRTLITRHTPPSRTTTWHMYMVVILGCRTRTLLTSTITMTPPRTPTLTRLIRLTITRVGVVEGSRAVEEVKAVEGSVGVVTEYRLGIDCQSSGRGMRKLLVR